MSFATSQFCYIRFYFSHFIGSYIQNGVQKEIKEQEVEPSEKDEVMKQKAYLKRLMTIALTALVCGTLSARPHLHHAPKPHITTVVVTKPVVKHAKKHPKKAVIKTVVITKKVYKR